MTVLSAPVESAVEEVTLQGIHWIKRIGQTQRIWIVSRQTSTRKDRIQGRHRGQRIGRLQIVACRLSSWEARQLPPLSGLSELCIDDEDCGRRVGVGLGGIDRDDYEIVSDDGCSEDDVVAVDWNRRMPTW